MKFRGSLHALLRNSRVFCMASNAPISPRDGDNTLGIPQGDKSLNVRTRKGVKEPDTTLSKKANDVSMRWIRAGVSTPEQPFGHKAVKAQINRPPEDPRSLTTDALRSMVEKEGGDPLVLSVQVTNGRQHLVTKSTNPTNIVGKVLGKMRGGVQDVPESDRPEAVLAVLATESNDPNSTLEDAQTLVAFYDFVTEWSEEDSKLDPKMKQQLRGLKEGLSKESISTSLLNAITTAKSHLSYANMELSELEKIYRAGKNSTTPPKPFARMELAEQIGFLKAFFNKLGPEGTLALVVDQTNAYAATSKETFLRENEPYSKLIKAFLAYHLQNAFQDSRGFKDLLKIAQAAALMKTQSQQDLATTKTGSLSISLLNQAWDGVVRDLQAVCDEKPDVQKFLNTFYKKCEALGIEPQKMVVNIIFLRMINPLLATEASKKGTEASQLLELSKAFQNAVNLTEDKSKDKATYTAQFVESHKDQILSLGQHLAGIRG